MSQRTKVILEVDREAADGVVAELTRYLLTVKGIVAVRQMSVLSERDQALNAPEDDADCLVG